MVRPADRIPGEDDDAPSPPLPFRFASQIDIVPITWLWRGRIAAGMLAVLDGDPDLGKSTMLADLTARITCGEPMPGDDASDGPGGVILISFEEHQGAVMVPRLMAAGANLGSVAIWNLDEQPFNLVDSLLPLGELIRSIGAKLVVIDPLVASLPSTLNAHRDQDVRSVLAPLAKLAENTGAAILLVRHLNKQSGGAALYRGGGSIGIIAAARTGLTLNRDPKLDDTDDDDGSRVLAVSKCNVGKKGTSLQLMIVSAPSPAPGIEVARIEWGGSCRESADSLLAPREERSELARAVILLREVLQDGPVPAATGISALRANDVAPRTESRAKKKLAITSKREGIKGAWWWYLPEHLPPTGNKISS